jgi:hypothetical protein
MTMVTMGVTDGALAAGEPRPVLADTLSAIKGLDLKIEFVSEPHDPAAKWVDAAGLASLGHGHLANMLALYESNGYVPNPRVGASVLMLRFGWVGGFAIAPYLTRARVPFLRDYGLCFPPYPGPGTRVLWVRDAGFVGRPDDPLAGTPEWIESVGEDDLRRHLLESLIATTEPLVAALYGWSHRARQALWAMAASSWAAQFLTVARALGDEERGVREARAMFALADVPELARAAPILYELRSGDTCRYFQRWGSCCLYFKVTERRFCMACPIVPDAERMERQRASLTKP